MPQSATLPGWQAYGWSREYGGVPAVPDPTSSAATAIGGNLGNLAQLYSLATGTGEASAAGARSQYQANLPMYDSLTTARSQNIASNLAGQVNPDVLSLMAQQAAERGVGFGPDSPNSSAAYLRALGMTSTGLQNLGQQQLGQAIATTPTGPAFDPSRFLVSPEMQQQAQYGANVMTAAPIPSYAARAAENAARRGMREGQNSVPPYAGVPTSGSAGATQRLGGQVSPYYMFGSAPGWNLPYTTDPSLDQAAWDYDPWADQAVWDYSGTDSGAAANQTQLGPVNDPWSGLADIWGGDLWGGDVWGSDSSSWTNTGDSWSDLGDIWGEDLFWDMGG